METSTVRGTCHHDCPDSCGWVATSENGKVIKLRGNHDHPFSKGELCPKVNKFVDRVYDPSRVLTPLIRVGPKGTRQFEPASWADALSMAADNLHRVIKTHGGQSVLPWYDAGTQGLLQRTSIDQRLFTKMGASRQTGSVCGATAGWGTFSTNGTAKANDPSDVRHADLVILWGTNTRLTNRHLWPAVEEAKDGGATIVVIDPIRTMTAESADWFIQPLPGTDVAMMLAIMHVLIRDDLIDHEYVQAHTLGFDELATHVADWTPERAAAICRIDADDITRLAVAYGTTAKSFIRTLIGAEHHEHGAMFFRALSCLPSLTGAWKHRGGGYARSVGAWFDMINHSSFDAPHLAPPGDRRGINQSRLGEALTDMTMSPPVHALVVWNGNPLVTIPNSELTRQGLLRDDLFTIVSEQFLTDTAAYADVVFPACTQLEQMDVVESWGHLYLGWNEPAIPPVGESVPNTELWRRLARAMGYTEPELFEDDDSLLRGALGAIDIDELRRVGFVKVVDDPRPFADGNFGFPHGKAEFVSESLAAQGLPALPTYLPAREGATAESGSAFPLALMTPKLHVRFLNSSYTHLPKHGPPEGGPVLDIAAEDALPRGIADGDQVRVFNDRGSLEMPARISDFVKAGIVSVPFGWQRDDHGGHGTANSLTSDTIVDWGGSVAYLDSSVEVELVEVT